MSTLERPRRLTPTAEQPLKLESRCRFATLVFDRSSRQDEIHQRFQQRRQQRGTLGGYLPTFIGIGGLGSRRKITITRLVSILLAWAVAANSGAAAADGIPAAVGIHTAIARCTITTAANSQDLAHTIITTTAGSHVI